VLGAASKTLKPVSLELGGKSPLIIFEDTPLEQALNVTMAANFYTQGQVCSNGTRIFIQESLYQEFTKAFIERVKNIRLGDPFAPDTQMGSLISASHLLKVEHFIHGDPTLLTHKIYGGQRPEWTQIQHQHLKKGFFLKPAVFTDIPHTSSLYREEVFGPVACLFPFKTEEEAIMKANDTSYGLAAGVMTQDIRKAYRVIHQLEAGICWINNYNITPPELPFGGFKQSGLGKENGLEAMEHFVKTKSIYVEMDQVISPF
jgi:betaine-aldehyde dehydrogenase